MEGGGAFLKHGLIEQDAEAFGEAGRTLGGEELQNIGEELRLLVVRHGGGVLDVFW